MLRTRLWMGAVLIALTVGVLVLDGRLEALRNRYPFLFLLLLILALLGCHEFLNLLGPGRRPWPWLCYAAVAALIVVNWPVHLWPWARDVSPHALLWVLGTYVAVVLAAFLTGLATYQGVGQASSLPDGTAGKMPAAREEVDTVARWGSGRHDAHNLTDRSPRGQHAKSGGDA